MKTCKFCHRTLPDTSFGLKYGRVRYKICRECLALGHSCMKRPEKPPREILTDKQMQERKREYMRKYREAHREKFRQAARASNKRRREGLPKLKPGPKKTEPGMKKDQPKQIRVPKVKGCVRCLWYPCFEGIENLESDFSKTCKSFRYKNELQ